MAEALARVIIASPVSETSINKRHTEGFRTTDRNQFFKSPSFLEFSSREMDTMPRSIHSRVIRTRNSTWQCSSTSVQERVSPPTVISPRNAKRETIRLALPSKGRMAEETLELLKSCQLTIRRPNPRQYIAGVVEMEGLEVWFQRASDIVRKIRSGDVDLGIVGFDMVKEFGQDDEDIIVVHDELGFGKCHLAVAVPCYGIFENVNSMDDLLAMPHWTKENPIRIVTGYTHLGKKWLEDNNVKNVTIVTADGALEAAPAMGTADAILDLVSSGTTLKENNLKELKGARVLASQGVLVASRKALLERKGMLGIAREMLERLEAHLRAKDRFVITANLRGSSVEEVAKKVWRTEFPGLQGPTISKVYSEGEGEGEGEGGREMRVDYYSVAVVVPKSRLYDSVKELREVGGSGVLVSPLTYIFDEEPTRWTKLLGLLTHNAN